MYEIVKRQKGITGLETAIILIAFVVVSAVLAYTVLSAGLFSTQKSQEAVYSSLQKVQGSINLKGGVTAYRDSLNEGGNGSIGRVEITVALSSEAGQVDLTPAYTIDPQSGALEHSAPGSNRLQIGFSDSEKSVADCAWTVKWTGNQNGDNMLDGGEKAVITVWLHYFDGSVWGPAENENAPFLGTHYVATGHTFTLEVRPPSGAVLAIQRTTPDFLFNVVSLE
ncbi:MAG TPA: archaellin/type IV pilin N-terminal domain-containing protein [Dehalococcoidales bacterium]|nr:archaellin/type IV pilin N-terminal domain-containing protein [Dehalococcoidales bacterium]